MRKIFQNTKFGRLLPAALLLILLAAVCEAVVALELLPRSVFAPPSDVFRAIPAVLAGLLPYLAQTALESAVGFAISAAVAFALAMAMDRFKIVAAAIRPLLVVMQAVPLFALAPLFVVWFGFGIAPKIVTVVLICSFPILIGAYEGLSSAPSAMLDLMDGMNAGYFAKLWHVKLPASVPALFSGMAIAGTYCVTGAVIGEWMGGDGGLGTLMMRYKNTYSYDKMFVVIIVICLLSLLIYGAVSFAKRILTPWDESVK